MSKKSKFIESLVNHWPSALVSQKKIEKFTGGVLTGRTMANLHSLAKRGAYEGPPLPQKICIGNRVAYRAEDVALFLWEKQTNL